MENLFIYLILIEWNFISLKPGLKIDWRRFALETY